MQGKLKYLYLGVLLEEANFPQLNNKIIAKEPKCKIYTRDEQMKVKMK